MVNGAVRFALFAFLLVFYYHWMCDEEWSGMADEDEDSQEDLLGRLSSSLHTKSGDRVLKGDDGSYKQDSEGLHSRQVLLEEMRQSCLPRLVCELFAMEDKSSLSESERSLMSLISQTSLGTRAGSSSNYHFAAHMGQLLVGVDGNSCQNFYPTCPLAGNQALTLARKMKIR